MSGVSRAFVVGLLVLALGPPTVAPAQTPAGPPRTDRYGDPLPEGAVARLGTLRLRHGGMICSVAFTPDGAAVASVAHGSAVLLWDVRSGREIRQFTIPQGYLRSVDFSRDGRLVLAADGQSDAVYLWDAATGKSVGRLGTPPLSVPMFGMMHPMHEVRNVAMSPDGKVLAKAQGPIKLWDVAGRKERGSLTDTDKPQPFACVAFAPDGRTLAAGSMNGPVCLWSWPRLGKPRRLRGHTDHVLCLAYTPDGKVLASGGVDRQVCLWDAEGRAIRALDGHRGAVVGLVFTPDGKRLVSASADLVRLWDVASGRAVRDFTGHAGRVGAIALSPDGRRLVAGTTDGAIGCWEVATGAPLVPAAGHDGPVRDISLAPDGKLLAAADGNRVCLWDVRESRLVRRLGEDGRDVVVVAYGPDGKRVAGGDAAGTVRVWEAATGKEVRRFGAAGDADRPAAGFPLPPHQLLGRVDRLTSGPGGSVLLTRHRSGLVRMWEPGSGRLLRTFGERLQEGQSGRFCALSPDGTLVAIGGSNVPTALWTTSKGRRAGELGGERESAMCGVFAPDGRTLATAAQGIRLWDVTTRACVRRLTGPKPWVWSVAFSPDGRMLASGGADEDIWVWEAATGLVRRRFRGHEGGYDRVSAVAFAPDGRTLASAGEDATVLVWDVVAPREVGPAGLTGRALADEWEALGGPDGPRAYDGLCRLAAAPAQSLPFLRRHLAPAPRVGPRRLAALVRPSTATISAPASGRTRELASLGEVAEAALRQAAAAPASAETRNRAGQLLAKLAAPLPPPDRLRAVRAVEILERTGAAEARALLRQLAAGAPEALLTREAKASLDRLARRPAAER